jgi:ABC-type transporter Mla maintaining outer membrane lipid asymmetry permease subunit MlaE
MSLEEAALCLRSALFLASFMGLAAGFMWATVWYGALDKMGGSDTLVAMAMRVELNEISPFLVAMVVMTAYASPSATRLARIRFAGGFDTLRLMGVPPAHLLVWPRFLGQLFAFPILLVFHCAFTVMGVGCRAFASLPVNDFLNYVVSGTTVYNVFRMAVQSVLMSSALSFFSLHYPYRVPLGRGVEIPELVRRGSLEGFFWASLSGLLVSVLYA